MTEPASACLWTAPARRRALIETAALAAPLLLALAAILFRVAGPVAAAVVPILLLPVAFAVAFRRASRFTPHWLTRTLDARHSELEDSSALPFRDDALGPLERLQRARIGERLQSIDSDTLAPPWHIRSLAAVAALCAVAVALALLWPRPSHDVPALSPGKEGLPPSPGIPRLVAQNLRIIPPAYTGLPFRDSASLDARVPTGSRLEWRLRFSPDASVPRLLMLGGQPVALDRDGGDWIASRTADAAFLYRVDPSQGRGPTPPLHRIDATPDMPPQVKALSPATGLTMVSPGQRSWTPVFAATDDYGVAPSARLRVTLAVGEGENVTFSEREVAVAGNGSAREKRFAPTLDFARFGFSAGGDMVVQLIVRDNRSPNPQEVRGPSLILRWPSARQPESSGLTGMVNTTLPAYFRSQRQIIIDAQALLKQRRTLSADRYLARSTSIGGDQQVLRGRYSQFLGGEEEGEPALPTADGEADGHDHGGPPAPSASGFGAPEDVLAAFGHPHDDSQASSLPPETRAILKQAVDQMWLSERELKQGHPDLALPFATKALRFIKEVQQATRIFLSRVGPELPPFDPSRRMTGKREGIASRILPTVPAERGDGPAAAAWRALGEGPDAIRGAIDLAPLERWSRANALRLPDALALTGAMDAVRRDPACASCREALRAQLWRAMERPLGQATRRPAPDAAGARYLGLIGRAR
ncbi:DUF4175 domain-containing protein [Sphingobium amiense]|uniref:DUF4175 domain-containing protein n=1 Tax=Sphingobium amiense TaxID=135719 RepID=A0A494W2G5_9SPHN|nr:DUF4175 family protein [Sphingobium amiense]BBD97338.1 DUF4175 domain-containing protein [Sphingobium amiense]